jgi:hypothetical protein
MWLWLTLSWISEWALLILAIARDMGVFHAHDPAVYIDRLQVWQPKLKLRLRQSRFFVFLYMAPLNI